MPEQNLTQDSNLSKELKALLKQATLFFQSSQDDKALALYDEVIKKSHKSHDTKILLLFTQAVFAKAMVHNIYPNNDPEAAIEDYEVVIQKFKNSDNKELLENYMFAKIEQAKLISKEELLSSYNFLIEKFKTDERFKKDIDIYMSEKSFLLMGENNEEAMEAFDKIIAKYQVDGMKKLPRIVENSIFNNIELSIITGNDDSKYRELLDRYSSDSTETKLLLDMLDIFKNAQDLDQAEALAEWKKENHDYNFPNWSFREIKIWANGIESDETKERILNYINEFEQQQLNQNYPDPYQNSSTNTNSTNQETSNQESSNEPVTYVDPAEDNDYPYEEELQHYSNPYENGNEPTSIENSHY